MDLSVIDEQEQIFYKFFEIAQAGCFGETQHFESLRRAYAHTSNTLQDSPYCA